MHYNFKMIDQGKEFIRQKIEEMLKAHDTHHLKKKFKRDIEKLEVFKVQFCDIYKNGRDINNIVCVLEGKEEETKLDLRNFEMNLPIQKEVHFIKITPTPTPHENTKRGMKESVPKDMKKKLNISTIEQGDINRPLTPVRLPPKNMKIAEKKNDYSTTPIKTNNLTITQIKLPEVKKDFEKSAKTERKEPSRQIKEDNVVKNKKEDISETKKDNKSKEEKKAKTESIEKIAANDKGEEKKKEKKEKHEESKHNPKEDKVVKKSDSIKQVKFNEEKRKSSSVVPENRNEFEKRASQDLNLNKDLKEDKRPSIKENPVDNKRKSIETNKVFESTPIKTTTSDTKRASLNKPAEARSTKTPEPTIDQKATTPNQTKRSSVSKTAETIKSQDNPVPQIQETKVEAAPDPKPIIIIKEEPKVEPKIEPVSIPTHIQQVEEQAPPKEALNSTETIAKITTSQSNNNESHSISSQPDKISEKVQEQPPVTIEENQGEAKKIISSALDKVEVLEKNNAEVPLTTIINSQVPDSKPEINTSNPTFGKKLKLNKLAEIDLSPNPNRALILMAYKKYPTFKEVIYLSQRE